MEEHEEEAVEYMKEKNHEGMIYGIIKRFGISRYSSSYDDYVVLGMILFVKGYVELMNRDLTQKKTGSTHICIKR